MGRIGWAEVEGREGMPFQEVALLESMAMVGLGKGIEC